MQIEKWILLVFIDLYSRKKVKVVFLEVPNSFVSISLFTPWYLVAQRVTWMVAFDFLRQNFGRWQGRWMLFCHAMNASWMVGIFLPAVIEKNPFLYSQVVKNTKNPSGSHPLHLLELAYTRATSWNLHYFQH